MTSEQFDLQLRKYAEVIVRVGLNLQPGQRLMIGAPFFGTDGSPTEASPLVRQIAMVAYQAGARYVGVNWDDEELQRIRVTHAAADTMDEFALWKNEVAIEYVDAGEASMAMISQNPDLMSGLDPQKVQAKQQTEAHQFHRLFSRMAAGASNWLAVGAAIGSWAAKVFPDLPQNEAVDRLWQAIFSSCRLDNEDPIAEWERHLSELAKRTAYLNGKQYVTLKYSAPGTDLSVGLPAGHIWHSGRLTSQSGTAFVANLPTEEVFTLAHKDRIDGVVRTTMPLSYGGNLIENFSLVFAQGRVVKATAESGQAALDSLLDTDEASRSLGEVALVPNSSPISRSKLIYYNVLFDENASSHLALGNAYRFNLQGGEGMTAGEFAAAGGNESMTHADFMIGSGDMHIDGLTAEGDAEPVMHNGEWVFDI